MSTVEERSKFPQRLKICILDEDAPHGVSEAYREAAAARGSASNESSSAVQLSKRCQPVNLDRRPDMHYCWQVVHPGVPWLGREEKDAPALCGGSEQALHATPDAEASGLFRVWQIGGRPLGPVLVER